MNGETDTKYFDMEKLRQNMGWFLALGIGLIILGILSIGMPLLATLAVTKMVGFLFLIGGAIYIVHAIRSVRGARLVLEILLSIVYVAAGLVLLTNPLKGAFTLTLFLIGFFIAEGVLKIFHAVRYRGVSNWGWMLFSGILSLVLAVLLLVGLPLTAFWALGVIVGIDFLFSGISIVMISLSMREAAREGKTFCIGNVCFAQ
jgi:uncharacterized membrane protein HdeD (DUF308 family)